MRFLLAVALGTDRRFGSDCLSSTCSKAVTSTSSKSYGGATVGRLGVSRLGAREFETTLLILEQKLMISVFGIHSRAKGKKS